MLRHYLVIGLRCFARERLYTAIHVIGLGIGMACSLLVYLFVAHEWSYDRFHANADRIFRPALKESYSAQQQFLNTETPFPLAAVLKEDFPEIENAVRILDRNNIVRANGQAFSERYHVVDPDLLRVFDFPLKAGDASTALKSPSAVVLSERMAKKYFGDSPALGRTVSIKLDSAYQDFIVTAIAFNMPSNSSIRFDILIASSVLPQLFDEQLLSSWGDVIPETYVLARPGTTAAQLEARVPSLVKRIMGSRYQEGAISLLFQPLTTIHLDGSFPPGLEPVSNPLYSYILASIATALLLIACINFMILAVARGARRAREVGIRKVSGAGRAQLIRQFWGETLLLTSLALLVSLAITEMVLPLFNDIARTELVLKPTWDIIAALVGLVLLVSIIGGTYPGLVLAGIRPVQVLKGKMGLPQGERLRQALVVMQFSMAIALIIVAQVMSRQLTYLQRAPLGYHREHVMVVPTNVGYEQSARLADLLRQRLVASVSAAHVAFVFNAPGEDWYHLGFKASPTDYRKASLNRVDFDFLPTLDIKLKAGRNFAPDHPSDTATAVLINEAFAQAFALSDPVGKPLPGSLSQNIVIGVIEDFHYESMRLPIGPLILTMRMSNVLSGVQDMSTSAPGNQRLLIRTTSSPEEIQRMWRAAAGDLPFEPQFLDDAVMRQYQSDLRLGRLVGFASLLVIIIASLGLFGLAAVSVVSRTKEIGIRRVLGASSVGIMALISREIVGLVLVANVIAWPIAYYASEKWLADFAYRSPLSMSSFLVAAFIALGAAIIALGYHSMRAAVVNAVESLRYE